jgi:carbon storage regulator
MLILTRGQGETIQIGEVVEITVLGMKAGQVRLGITAPESVKILRGELLTHRNDDKRREATK